MVPHLPSDLQYRLQPASQNDYLLAQAWAFLFAIQLVWHTRLIQLLDKMQLVSSLRHPSSVNANALTTFRSLLLMLPNWETRCPVWHILRQLFAVRGTGSDQRNALILGSKKVK